MEGGGNLGRNPYIRCMKRLFLLLCLMTTTVLLPAQQFVPGQVLLTNGDTLDGLIGFTRGVMVFKETSKSPIETVKKDEIASYKLGKQSMRRIRVLIKLNNFPEYKEGLAEVLVDGPVALYRFTSEDIYGNIYDTYHLCYDEGNPWMVPEKPQKFRKQVSDYFESYDDLAARIDKRELTIEDLPQIVMEFNEWYEGSDAQ